MTRGDKTPATRDLLSFKSPTCYFRPNYLRAINGMDNPTIHQDLFKYFFQVLDFLRLSHGAQQIPQILKDSQVLTKFNISSLKCLCKILQLHIRFSNSRLMGNFPIHFHPNCVTPLSIELKERIR